MKRIEVPNRVHSDVCKSDFGQGDKGNADSASKENEVTLFLWNLHLGCGGSIVQYRMARHFAYAVLELVAFMEHTSCPKSVLNWTQNGER